MAANEAGSFSSVADDSSDDIVVLCTAIHQLSGVLWLRKKRKKGRTSRSCWVSPINNLRPTYGAFNSTMAQLEISRSSEWRNYMRMDRYMFTALLQSIMDNISKNDTQFRRAIPPAERLAVTLRYVASAESFTSLHYQFCMGKSTISEIVPDVCSAIYTCLYEQYLHTPTTPTEWETIAKDYYDYWNFPNCLGSIDGKHIVIRTPWHSGSIYHNYKGAESIVLMAIVDARHRFTYLHVGSNGRISDGGLFKETNFYKALENGGVQLGIPGPKALPEITTLTPYVLVADDAFALSDHLMKPYARRNLTDHNRKIFNYRLSRARRIVENAFGIVAATFRVFEKPIAMEPEKAEKITLACCVLHNYIRDKRGISDNDNGMANLNSLTTGQNYSRQAGQIRHTFCEFFNGVGALSWQNNMI